MIYVVHTYDMPKITMRSTIVYVGRPTILGNPFSMRDESLEERIRVCNLYSQHLDKMLLTSKEVRTEMNRLYLLARKGDLYLRCFCAPKQCHADYIKQRLDDVL